MCLAPVGSAAPSSFSGTTWHSTFLLAGATGVDSDPSTAAGVPVFLRSVAREVLAAGKATRLLRTMEDRDGRYAFQPLLPAYMSALGHGGEAATAAVALPASAWLARLVHTSLTSMANGVVAPWSVPNHVASLPTVSPFGVCALPESCAVSVVLLMQRALQQPVALFAQHVQAHVMHVVLHGTPPLPVGAAPTRPLLSPPLAEKESHDSALLAQFPSVLRNLFGGASASHSSSLGALAHLTWARNLFFLQSAETVHAFGVSLFDQLDRRGPGCMHPARLQELLDEVLRGVELPSLPFPIDDEEALGVEGRRTVLTVGLALPNADSVTRGSTASVEKHDDIADRSEAPDADDNDTDEVGPLTAQQVVAREQQRDARRLAAVAHLLRPGTHAAPSGAWAVSADSAASLWEEVRGSVQVLELLRFDYHGAEGSAAALLLGPSEMIRYNAVTVWLLQVCRVSFFC